MGKASISSWLFGISIFFLLFITPKYSYADVTINDSIFTVTHDPKPVFPDSGTITVTIKTTVDFFDPNLDYVWTIQHVGQNEDFCSTAQKNSEYRTTNPKKFIASWTIIGCRAEVGNWTFRLYRGTSSTRRDPIVTNYPVTIEQQGGQLPGIVAENTPLKFSDTPKVTLINARNGNKYTFWWDGAGAGSIAKHYTAPKDGTIFGIDIGKDGLNTSKVGLKKLCMEIGDYNFPAPVGLTCRYPTNPPFDFQLLVPTPSPSTIPSCLIQPAKPAEGDSVALAVNNVSQNQDFLIYLQKGGSLVNSISQNSGSNNQLVADLVTHIDKGDYTAHVFKSPDFSNRICPIISFTVGPPGTGVTTVTNVCDPKDPSYDPTKCALAGGKPCGDPQHPEDPAIATAIGCIHTSPIGFTQDILKFAVAISGGIAFLMMIMGAFQMLTSAGNPETLKNGQDRLTSAIVGLLIVILAVILLRFIGVDILGILPV